jgi:tetratricopeptide (TPR) repeat protein
MAFLVSMLLVALGLARSAAAADDDDDARAHHRRGVEFYGRGRFAEALAEFEGAYALHASPGLLFNLGQTQYQLRHYARALRSLHQYLATATNLTEERSADVREQLEDLKAKTGQVALSIDVMGATVSLDGRPLGSSPLTDPVLVDAGQHRIDVKRSGYSARTAAVDVEGGQLVRLHLKLVPLPSQPSVPLPPEPGRALQTSLWIVTAGLGALAVGGVVGTWVQRERYEEARRSPQSGDPAQVRHGLDDERSDVRRWALAADVLAAACAMTGGLALYVSLQAPAELEPTVSAGGALPSRSRAGAALSASLQF